jgi:hypothetical protein
MPASICSWSSEWSLRQLRKLVAAQAVEARVADMGDGHLVVVEQCQHQRRAHAGILRLTFGSVVDCGIGLRYLDRRIAEWA